MPLHTSAVSLVEVPDIIKIISHDTSPPLWNIFEWFVFNTLGTSEIYIRGLAFFFFLITVFFTYKIGSFLWGRNTGILAALLTALNPFFFTYAFEGRMYSIMSAGVAGSMYFFIRLMHTQKRVSKRHLLGYILMTLWAIYSHHFAMFTLAIQGLWFLYFLIRRQKNALGMFIGFACVGLGYLPWLQPLYGQLMMVKGGFWLGKPNLVDLIALILEYLAFGIKHYLAFPALVFVSIALLFRRWRRDVKYSLFLATWFLGPILLAFIVSLVFQSVFFNRYLLYTIPAAMLLVASNARRFGVVIISLALVLFAIIDITYFTHPTKLPFPTLAKYLQSSQMPGDFLINWNSNGTHHLWETKYYGLDAPIYIEGQGELPYFIGTALMEKSDLVQKIPNDTKRVGVVTTGAVEEIKIPGYTESVLKNFDGLKFVWFTPSTK